MPAVHDLFGYLDTASREADQGEEFRMPSMFTAALAWLRSRDERGATAVEYGMLVALIAAVIVVVVTTLGTQVNDAFQTISDALP
jgi:pilus assembly protein Flp/PilA